MEPGSVIYRSNSPAVNNHLLALGFAVEQEPLKYLNLASERTKTMSTFKTIDPTKVERKPKGAVTKYLSILQKVSELKGGEGFVVPIPPKTSPSSYRNRVQIKTRTYKPTIPAGTYIATSVTKDETGVIVELVKGEKPVERRGRPKGTAKAKPAKVPSKLKKAK